MREGEKGVRGRRWEERRRDRCVFGKGGLGAGKGVWQGELGARKGVWQGGRAAGWIQRRAGETFTTSSHF